MIVSHSLRFIYISNPKTASKSVEAALAVFQEEPELDEISREGFFTKRHIPAWTLREHLPESVWRSYFKCAFVRNPWDWFVSQHFYNLVNNRDTGDIDRALPLSRDDILGTYEYLKQRRGVDWSESGFQHSFVCDDQGVPLVDFVGRFEHLAADFAHVQTRIGTQVALSRLNTTEHAPYRSYYTDETSFLIYQLYHMDIRIFGYDFG